MKKIYLIPLVTIITMSVGGWITSANMDWYDSLNLPAFTPEGSFIGTVWTILFILATIAALLVWRKPTYKDRRPIAAVFLLNALLNMGWSFLFFGLHLIGPAVFEAALLGVSVLVLIIMAWPFSKIASWLLVPYFAWVSFATYLTYSVWVLNR